MAFEVIVKEQLERLKEPTLKCVDMVVHELTEVVQMCSQKVRFLSENCQCHSRWTLFSHPIEVSLSFTLQIEIWKENCL